jgi:hypothetical protein
LERARHGGSGAEYAREREHSRVHRPDYHDVSQLDICASSWDLTKRPTIHRERCPSSKSDNECGRCYEHEAEAANHRANDFGRGLERIRICPSVPSNLGNQRQMG